MPHQVGLLGKLHSSLFRECRRSMTTSKRVQDRSKKKRVHDLEIVVEKHKILSKILFILETLKQESEQIIPVRSLDQYRRQINLPKPHKFSVFLRKCPKLFELYKDQRGILWCGMTKEAENLLQEEEELIEKNSDKAAEFVTRMLMMSIGKRISLDKIVHFRRDIGLPLDFRSHWVHKYPDYFRVVRPFVPYDEGEYLELVNWKSSWAITELEKKVMGVSKAPEDYVPGFLSLSFPMKFPPNYKKLSKYRGQIENFQNREYLSPYADASGLKAGSQDFDKRAVAVIHELLSLMIEKRLVTDHLTHFRREFVMPQKLMRLLLKHFGIFYVSERGRRFTVFLNEPYEGSELVEKHPLVVWKEKVLSLVGYRKKKDKEETLEDLQERDTDLFEIDSEDYSVQLAHENEEEEMSGLESDSIESDSEMEIEEIYNAYKVSE
ncbi:protein WHAT'S THIS FACTOR 1 homolog, chloroplastic-like isoform X2 [Ipomoea triloba]|uniref:protein WHAT'S THIS FACTOR 1 homolog, chloroplastic-like isoform X2 n=1 Tax=Ipomoea triloba TaxID=35885 RepID=UPI00125DDBAE|nr:protein WHAT'S THIS FACTOR 1 homolog, chloroplastic-like isoform X2 [Ipomoea triloba]